MKYLHIFITLHLLFSLAACYGTDSKTGDAGNDHSLQDLAKDASAKISHEEGWTIVSKLENGDRVYWFLAPEVDNVSPAMFKKIVYTGTSSELETKTVSECEAPKQTCDDLMATFKILSEKYK